MTRRTTFAVIGCPIDHSLSPTIHHLFAQQTGKTLSYTKKQSSLPEFVNDVTQFFYQGGGGLNITAPFKELAYTLSREHGKDARMAQSVNTLWQQDGIIYGDNTDGLGFIRDITHYTELTGKRVLILGAGGAARAILPALLRAQPGSCHLLNRTLSRAHQLIQEVSSDILVCTPGDTHEFDIVINTTRAEFSVEQSFFSSQLLTGQPLCYDLNYNLVKPTTFLRWSKSNACASVDGLGMLVAQAAEAFNLWHGCFPDDASVLTYLEKTRQF